MLIKPSENKTNKKTKVLKEIESAYLSGPLSSPVCTSNCKDYNPSIGCDRMCSSASKMLSSEKEDYPLEEIITPLVFEIKKLGVFEPCWSCEGHNDTNGQLWKKPSVWFYCSSNIHIRVLSDALSLIYNMRTLSTRWVIELTHSDQDNLDTTFSLKPRLNDVNISLERLQEDVKIIHDNLAAKFKISCERLRNSAL